MSKPTITHIVDYSDPNSSGLREVLPAMFDRQREDGWEVEVIEPDEQDASAKIRQAGVVHVHGLLGPGIAAHTPLLWRYSKFYVLSTYAYQLPARGTGWVFKRAWNWFFRGALVKRAWCLHALTQRESDFIKRTGFHRRVKVLPIGIGRHQRPIAQADSKSTIKQPYIVNLGPANSQESMTLLLRAVRELLQQDELRLVIACELSRPMQDALEQQIRHLGLDQQVTVIAAPTQEQVGDLLGGALAVIDTMRRPYCPVGLLRGMSAGRPAIATESSGLESIGSLHAGWYVRPSRRAIEDALHQLLGRTDDELQRMGKAAAWLVQERYNWQRLSPEYLNLYQRLLDGRE